jgi:hypothetical protein
MRTTLAGPTSKLAAAALTLVGSLLVSGCTDRSGPTDPESARASTGTGPTQITIWTNDSSPSPIQVYVDGRAVGVLTVYRSAPPGCGEASSASAGVITVSVTAGSHTVRAEETRGGGYWGPMTVQVSSGSCRILALNP